MAHAPLACVPHEPQSALVICFGMGATFRSLASWGIDVTAVELVPGVRDAFGYYFEDAPAILEQPRNRIVVDDGRRFLRRTSARYDVITIDPPPPVEAAGSSLLYSVEFYDVVKRRLKPGGVLQQWFPGGEAQTVMAVAGSLDQAFAHVRVFRSIDNWGYHFLASVEPLAVPSADELAQRLPPRRHSTLRSGAPGATCASTGGNSSRTKCRSSRCLRRSRASGSPTTGRTTSTSCCAGCATG
jgi:spermidine synthase